MSSLEKSLSEKCTHIPGCQKSGAFHIWIKKKWVSHILFVEKRVGAGGGGGLIINLAALKKGAIRHAHPYYAIYRKLLPPQLHPHPQPPRGCTIFAAHPAVIKDSNRHSEIDLCTLTHLCLVFHKKDIGKQCRPRSDATKRGVWSESTLFALRSNIFYKTGYM